MLSILSAKPTHRELSYKEILPLAPEHSRCLPMICSIIEYVAVIWSPYTQSVINNLETVQLGVTIIGTLVYLRCYSY